MREWNQIFREWTPITHSFMGVKVSILNELCHKVDYFASRALFFCYSLKSKFTTLVESHCMKLLSNTLFLLIYFSHNLKIYNPILIRHKYGVT